ncbi:MAG: putative bifunctional diguanylate cyclase/phosphodiesterase [Janthinobacterium lividum]
MHMPFPPPVFFNQLFILPLMVALAACILSFLLARHLDTEDGASVHYWRAGGALALGAGLAIMHGLLPSSMVWHVGWPSHLVIIALIVSWMYLGLLVLLRRPPPCMPRTQRWRAWPPLLMLLIGSSCAALYTCAMQLAAHLGDKGSAAVQVLPGSTVLLLIGGAAMGVAGLALCSTTLLARRQTRQAVLAAALQKSNLELQQIAFHDDLTKLPNRMLLADRLAQAVARARREANSIALLFIDLDGFKHVNDTQGHEAGDHALREIAKRITALLRSSDTVARFGGDEFVVLVDAVEDRTGLAMLARRIETEVAAPLSSVGGNIQLSASIGIAVFPDDAVDEKQLLHCADTAMYAAKTAGKNTHRFHDAVADASPADSMIDLCDLRLALERSQFELFYEPKMDGRGAGMVSVEALIRWRHPKRGVVSPREFIAIAERHSLIVPIGRWVIDDACRQMRVWRELGWRIPVSVNLSLQQLRQPGLVEQIRASLARHMVDATLLTLEISEISAMDHAEHTLNALLALAQLGVHLSLDDFGTGFSNLRYLQRFPVAELKIDRSIVNEVEHSCEARAIVAAAINLAHSLNLRVVAEGVETMRQKEYLSILRCDEFQGHLFALPMRAGELTSSLLEHRLVLRALAPEFEGGA